MGEISALQGQGSGLVARRPFVRHWTRLPAIPRQDWATQFYVIGLGLTRDPYMRVGLDNMEFPSSSSSCPAISVTMPSLRI